MKKGAKVLVILMSLIITTSCTAKNEQLRHTEDISSQADLESAVPSDITVEAILERYSEWEGNKDPGKVIYTLSLDNDKYILTIFPNSDNTEELNWIEIIYIKTMEKNTIVSTDEIRPLMELVSYISPYLDEGSKWSDNILNRKLPFEESTDQWNLKIDYYVYQGKNEGICLKIENLEKTIDSLPTIDIKAVERKELANAIKMALNAPGHPSICTSVYFNTEGELIIEATSYWGNMSENDREDIIFLIKGILGERKEELGVEGYGQFFSPAGRGLDSFYAK